MLYAAEWVPRYACAAHVDRVLATAGVDYVIGGSFGAFLRGSSRIADDLDLHVLQKDVLHAVRALVTAGFKQDPGQRSRLVIELVPADERFFVPKSGSAVPFHVQVVNAEEMMGAPIAEEEL